MSSPSGVFPAARSARTLWAPPRKAPRPPSRALTPRFPALGRSPAHSGAPAQPLVRGVDVHEGDRPDARHRRRAAGGLHRLHRGPRHARVRRAAPLPQGRRRRPPQDRPRSPGLPHRRVEAERADVRPARPLGRDEGGALQVQARARAPRQARLAHPRLDALHDQGDSLGGDLRVRRPADYRRAAQARAVRRPRPAPSSPAPAPRDPRLRRNSAQFCEI